MPERARTAGLRLRDGLDRLSGHEGVAGFRGEGLMQAVALEPPVIAGAVVEALLERGVIARALPYANAVGFSPPLVIADAEIGELVEALGGALGEVGAAS